MRLACPCLPPSTKRSCRPCGAGGETLRCCGRSASRPGSAKPKVTALVIRLLEEGKVNLLVDIRKVGFLDSSGLGALASLDGDEDLDIPDFLKS